MEQDPAVTPGSRSLTCVLPDSPGGRDAVSGWAYSVGATRVMFMPAPRRNGIKLVLCQMEVPRGTDPTLLATIVAELEQELEK